tara:strand:+ start:53 stop:352 length:300 start_codon:yes stop_codon:yes gene_type:complete
MSKIKNKNFTKKDISKKINLKIGISNAYASKITDDFINVLKNLIKNNETNIKNFATFRIINKADRTGRNPKSKEIYKIKARKSLSFITSKKFNDKIQDL